MEFTSDISECKEILEELSNTERIKDDQKFRRLSSIFEHLPAQVAPRLQKDLDFCLIKSHEVLAELFDKVEVSDKALLNCFLKLLLSYGHLRMSLIIYHIESFHDELLADPMHSPDVVKSKWYDLTPLLPAPPEDSSLSWKHLLVHALVIDERKLFHTSFKLLIQKLHFHAALLSLDRYTNSSSQIRRGGVSLAKKISEIIIDFAHDDNELIGIDSFIFKLMVPFTDISQQSAIVEAIVLARFKTRILCNPGFKTSRDLLKLDELISDYIMDQSNLQEILFVKLIEQLKCNIMLREKRHSVETGEEKTDKSLECCLSDIIKGSDSTKIISAAAEIDINKKEMHKEYLNNWTEFILGNLKTNVLTPKSSSMLLQACSTTLIASAQTVDGDLNRKISKMMANILDATNQRWSQSFFKACGIDFLIEFTKALATKSGLLDDFDTPLRRFYSSYFAKYLRLGLVLKNQQNVDKFASFITFICDNNLGKDKSHIFEHIIVRELACLIDDIGVKGCNKLSLQYLEHDRVLSKKLYRFIKRSFIHKDRTSFSDAESSPEKILNDCKETCDRLTSRDQVQAVAIDALVSILKIVVEKKEQDILDHFGELTLRLYNLVCSRTTELIDNLRNGSRCTEMSIDSYLPRLMSLYIKNKSVIEPYLCYDLSKKMSDLLFKLKDSNSSEEMTSKSLKKSIYNEIKVKLDAVQSKGESSNLVYQTLINRQYNSKVDQPIIQKDSIKQEIACCESYSKQLRILGETIHILFNHCDPKLYQDALQRAVIELEECDSLDHANLLYLLLLIESFIPKSSKDDLNMNSFKAVIPRISCCLIIISKLVDLGPSIHSFTNAGSHKSASAIQCCTYSNCIKIFTLLFRKYPDKIADQFMTDAMQVCVSSNLRRYAEYSSRLHSLFIQLASSIAGILKSICISRKQNDALKSSMPIFLSVFTTLVRCVMLASDRRKLAELPRLQMNGHGDSMSLENSGDETHPRKKAKFSAGQVCKVYEANLENLAHDIGRLMNNLSFLESKLIDYAPHVISTYIKDTQHASCPDFVKKHLDEGVFRIFNLIDAYQREKREEVIDSGIQRKTFAARASGSLFDMIHARLDQSSREIFRDLHDNYNKFHRYQGRC